ncbi:DsbA family oxidoreductase [Pararhodobacter sp. SW119]|uniref:DsbA family oxidoreductase n=1 Tax=Pararhodobacter sp. SW119 TaxID=2780075 RepID=UPI001AE0C419|nr:DsbA family oxidoreductase [Pararhodobacter sp. SW119]
MIRLDIFSDPICPWCYIGKAGLDAALEARADHPFAVEWHPFMLNPDMPAGGMDRAAYLEAKFGSKEDAVKRMLTIQQAAEAAGVPIDFAAQTRLPSTLDAHRLIHWAGLEGRQNAVVAALFRAYFVDGADIGEPEVLTGIAGAAGLDAAMIARLLESDGDVEEIRARDADIRARGLSGVPAFIIDGQHVLHGAQPRDVWLQVIDQMAGRA